MEFSLILKQLRKEKGLSQRDLAKLLNLSHSAIGLYETGKREPDFKTLKLLSRFFNVSTDFLIGNEDIPGKRETSATSKEELEYLEFYRSLDDAEKRKFEIIKPLIKDEQASAISGK